MTNDNIVQFVPGFASSVRAVLARGWFNNASLQAQVAADWDALAPVPENRLANIEWDAAVTFQQALDSKRAAEKQLATMPRGTWVLIVDNRLEDKTRWSTIIADGFGSAHYRSDAYEGEPTFAKVAERMFSYEVYIVRAHVDAEMERERSLAAIDEHKIQPGVVFKQVRHGTVEYDNAKVTVVDRNKGLVQVELTSKGRKGFKTALMDGHALAKYERATMKPVPNKPAPDHSLALGL